MATPAMQLQTGAITLQQDSAQTLDLGVVKDPSGTPIDIDTGYVAALQWRYGNGRDKSTVPSITGTYSYGSAGELSVALTQAQSNQAPVGSWPYYIILTNDAFATYSIHKSGTFVVKSGP
jgi:hypothetical protein